MLFSASRRRLHCTKESSACTTRACCARISSCSSTSCASDSVADIESLNSTGSNDHCTDKNPNNSKTFSSALRTAWDRLWSKDKVASAAAENDVADGLHIDIETKHPDKATPQPASSPWVFLNVSIHTIEHVDAPRVVTSEHIMHRLGLLVKLAGVKPDALQRVTGIKERRLWEEGTTVVQAATWAAQKALDASGVPPSHIGVIVNTSVSRDYYEPSVACCVHHELRLPDTCINFDITNACVGTFDGIMIVAGMIEAGTCDYGMVIGVEAVHELQEATIKRLRCTASVATYRSQMATLTLGCGSVAMVLCRSDLSPPGRNHRITQGLARAASHAYTFCHASRAEMVTNTRDMVVEGEKLFKLTWEAACKELGWSADSLDYAVPHQVSNKIQSIASSVTGISQERLASVYPVLGNMGPGGMFVALSRAEKEGLIKPGMRVGLFAIGSGLNCCMAEVMW